MNTLKRRCGFSVLSFLLVMVAAFFLWPGSATAAIDPVVERVILQGDLKQARQILGRDTKEAGDPVARLLVAQACLAANRDNEALLLFHSVEGKKDKERWSLWTGALLRNNPKNPMALYLSADALARRGRWREATERLSRAIEIRPAFPLARMTRGILYFLTNKHNMAILDLGRAAGSAPQNAYIQAALGIYYILTRAPEGALSAFNRAIEINPRSSLAYNGRGCAYFGMGYFDKAAWNFRAATRFSPALLSAEINYSLATAAALRFIRSNGGEKAPGTTLKSIAGPSWLNMPKGLLKTDFSTLAPQKIPALIKEYGPDRVRMAMTYGFSRHMAGILDHVSSLNRDLSGLRAPGREALMDIMQLQLAEAMDTAASSALFNRPPSTGWGRYTGMPTATIDTQGKGWAENLRQSARGDVRDWIKGSLVAPFKPDWLSNLETIVGIGSGLAAPEGRTPAEAIDRLKPLSALGGPMSGLLVPLVKAYYGMVFDALGSMDIQGRMTSMDRDYVARHKVYAPMPAEIAAEFDGLGYYIAPKQPLTDLNALATRLSTDIKAPQRRVLIVSSDPFRSTLQQQELYNRGFHTMIMPPVKDALKLAHELKADAIIGIKNPYRTIDLNQYKLNRYIASMPTRTTPYHYNPLASPSKWRDGKLEERPELRPEPRGKWERFHPHAELPHVCMPGEECHPGDLVAIPNMNMIAAPSPGPYETPSSSPVEIKKPGSIGGVFMGVTPVGIPADLKGLKDAILKACPSPMGQYPPPLDWSWAKPFVPNYPGGAPGGVSMREIARAFVDKGNWPLLIGFGIGYK